MKRKSRESVRKSLDIRTFFVAPSNVIGHTFRQQPRPKPKRGDCTNIATLCVCEGGFQPCKQYSTVDSEEFRKFALRTLSKYSGFKNGYEIDQKLRLMVDRFLRSQPSLSDVFHYQKLLEKRGNQSGKKCVVFDGSILGKSKTVNIKSDEIGGNNNIETSNPVPQQLQSLESFAAFVFVPFAIPCFDNYQHFGLFVLDTVEKKYFVYDPAGYKSNGRPILHQWEIIKIYENIKSHLQISISKHLRRQFSWDEYENGFPDDLILPTSVIPCSSICVCAFAEQYSRGVKHIFIDNYDGISRLMAAELLEKELFLWE